jgi:hypothetical protein
MESKTVSFKIGSGGAKIVLSTDNGDVRIKKRLGLPGRAECIERAKARLAQSSSGAERASPEALQGAARAAGHAINVEQME